MHFDELRGGNGQVPVCTSCCETAQASEPEVGQEAMYLPLVRVGRCAYTKGVQGCKATSCTCDFHQTVKKCPSVSACLGWLGGGVLKT